MDIVTYALCKKMIASKTNTDSFKIKGSVSSIDNLPSSGNSNGDMYIVGPNVDGSYNEYYWLENANKWELLGGTATNANVFNIKGSVASVSNLPATGNQNGDVYLVGPDSDDTYDEYYWLASENKWEFLGNTDSGSGGGYSIEFDRTRDLLIFQE